MNVYSYVIIDGYKYAVLQGTYIRKWQRQFTQQLVANIVELNWVDRGPGIKTYNMSLILETWPSNHPFYQAGITQTWDQQLAHLEASYMKVNYSMQLVDPFGQSPTLGGVYFTNLNQTVPNYATAEKPYLLADVEFIDAKQAIS
jgi:patatin-like phospholipase/acyl hydrolase